jgi:hypothetical protein
MRDFIMGRVPQVRRDHETENSGGVFPGFSSGGSRIKQRVDVSQKSGSKSPALIGGGVTAQNCDSGKRIPGLGPP